MKLEEITSGYELADYYVGSQVRVYLDNGAVISGVLLERTGKYIRVLNRFKKVPALVHLDKITSIT